MTPDGYCDHTAIIPDEEIPQHLKNLHGKQDNYEMNTGRFKIKYMTDIFAALQVFSGRQFIRSLVVTGFYMVHRHALGRRFVVPTAIAILLFYSPLIATGQTNFKNPPWDIGCDTMITQTDMNSCSAKSFKIADSILTSEYDTLIFKLNNRYKTMQAERKDDSANENYFSNLIEIIKTSQKAFYKYRKSTIQIPEEEYSGGTIRPLMVNDYALKLTVDRIKMIQMIRQDMAKFIR
jgi:uncharacterized protein YecT (DUF1311 family)